jgi:hypothetical protein
MEKCQLGSTAQAVALTVIDKMSPTVTARRRYQSYRSLFGSPSRTGEQPTPTASTWKGYP